MTTAVGSPGGGGDLPRLIDPGREPTDRAFTGIATGVGLSVLVMTGAIGAFLGYQAIPTLHHYGLHYFTGSQWNPELDQIGIAAVLLGTLEVAVVAMVVSTPLALLMALFISDFSPRWLKSWLVSAIDLMAAVPSIIYGLWGFFLLEPRAIDFARWLSQHFGFLPFFHVDTDPNAEPV
jgi:phosphate transport system permease protein